MIIFIMENNWGGGGGGGGAGARMGEVPHIMFTEYITSRHIFGELLSPSDAVAVPGGMYGAGSGPVFISQLTCSGVEDSVLHCPLLQTIGLTPCDHSRDAGVRCVGKVASGTLCYPSDLCVDPQTLMSA